MAGYGKCGTAVRSNRRQDRRLSRKAEFSDSGSYIFEGKFHLSNRGNHLDHRIFEIFVQTLISLNAVIIGAYNLGKSNMIKLNLAFQ